MKKIKLLTFTVLALTIISFKAKSLDKIEKDNNEIIGTWIRKTEQKSSEKSVTDNILEISFKKNLTAKIKVTDTAGTKIITGKWSSDKTENYTKAVEPTIKKLFGENFKSQVVLEYLRNGKGLNIIGFSLEQTENGLVLKAGTLVFEKK